MKNLFLTLVAIITSVTTLFGQIKESQHFAYEKTKSGLVTIKPKNEANPILWKGRAVLAHDDDYESPWDKPVFKTFQELIDQGTLSRQRMQELEKKDQTSIKIFFDETGRVSYVSFYIPSGKESLLTDEELCKISKKCKEIAFDMTHVSVNISETGSKTSFYTIYTIDIPFKNLKY